MSLKPEISLQVGHTQDTMASDQMTIWRDCIRAWYPDYETKTYFVPPVVITRIPFDVVTVAGLSVLVPQCNPDQVSDARPSSKQVKVQCVQESDTRDDLGLQRVLVYLRELTSKKSEPMFVVSQLQFSSYLGESCYAAAAKQFTRPQNLSKDYRRGDFDILIIHRHYGIITGEIKSVLSNQQQLQLSQPDVDRVVTDRVRNAIKTLSKSEIVLREITKDLELKLAIRKLLILPYVPADVLRRVISSDEQLRQELLTCLQTVDFEQALQCCLLAENLSFCGDQTVNERLRTTWWSTFTVAMGENEMMTCDLYSDLLARFCGPATTVSVYWPTSPRIEVRTEGQGVAITGKRMTSLVLTLEQISLLNRAPTKVLLTGPPGVGKSVMLVLMTLTWLRQGHDVHLVSVWSNSLAVTRMIKHVIQVSVSDDPTISSVVGSVLLHEYQFCNKKKDVDKAINELTATSGSPGPYVICDELWADDRHIARCHRFVTELCTRLPNVCLWAASPYQDQRPAELQEEPMATPLRCPPAVLREIEAGLNTYSKNVHPYTKTALTMPCDGPNIIHLSHQGPEHPGYWPLECVKCGELIARTLQRLGLGMADSSSSGKTRTVTTVDIADNSHANITNVSKASACTPLKYSDVFVLTRSADLRDDATNEKGFETSKANGVVRGLRNAGIPVRVIRTGHESTDVSDTVVAQIDKVTVTHCGPVSGLERKVVVWLPGKILDRDHRWTSEQNDAHNKLHAKSRCTAQLVVIDCPVSHWNRHFTV